MHSQFWKQCHKVETIQNKMYLWFCIYLWFLKYYSIAMHWLTLEISLHYNANSTSGSSHHLIPLDQSFSSPHLFCFLAHFLFLIGASTHQCFHLCHSKACCVACDNKWPHPKRIRHLVWLHKKYPKHIFEYTKIIFYCNSCMKQAYCKCL